MLISPLYPEPLLPVGPWHPGAFGYARHQHIHTGVDLYAPMGCPVRAMEDGRIEAIRWFTGPEINMPWWNSTRAVYIDGETGVFNYGEILEISSLKVGQIVKQGETIGFVMPVLRKYKGRPMSMLHVELYDHGYTDDWGEWKIGSPKPEHLLDPTDALTQVLTVTYMDPYESCPEDPEINRRMAAMLMDHGKFLSEGEKSES